MLLDKYINYATESFTLPQICLKMREVLDDNRSDAEDIGRLISFDPSLTAKILRLANSALFRFPSQIDSVSKAISVIGGEALYNLVIAETANTAFKHFNSQYVDIQQHWYLSVYNGVLAKMLAKSECLRGSERFFVLGILNNLSELVVAKYDPENYLAYKQLPSDELPWQKQQRHFGFTFAACSGAIMEKWHLPMKLYYPVKCVHDAAKQAEDADIGLLACSMRVTIRENIQSEYGSIELLTPEITHKLNIDNDNLKNIITFANTETEKVAAAVL
ncbi:HDOD domain-containing protein [Alteromonas sp. C1M14]|uniref:HDOD domain-containing protein n=1 Tax=Alteromonas sp. C1M14 TaxID=2841567 RepID=UPI001C093697|nr:HDOD domain-containing protein [Alteromonas sp. C1M14]MBU2979384.1 HDOD domain-containing protein [Alteromonas sp. C1M14]